MAVSIQEMESDGRKKPKLNAWKPKRWKADYDRIVAFHVMGKKNVEIARALHMTPEHVSTILNLPQAQQLKDKMQAALREKMVTNIPETLEYISRRTVERFKQVLDDDELFQKAPLAIIDRGLEVMKGTGHLKGGGNGSAGITVHGNAMIVPAQQAQGLLDGFNKADEARQLNAGPATPE
jgi:hypothetical protein